MSNIQVTKQPFTAKPKKLKASWTIETTQDFMYSEDFAKVLQEETDRQVLWGVRKDAGWQEVTLPYPIYGITKNIINNWCSENLKGSFDGYREKWIFELPEEATWFTLRWFEQEQEQKKIKN